MAECEATTKKWGNSIGIILPKETVEQAGIKENEKLKIVVVKENQTLRKFYGKFKERLKKTSQELKNDARKELY